MDYEELAAFAKELRNRQVLDLARRVRSVVSQQFYEMAGGVLVEEVIDAADFILDDPTIPTLILWAKGR